MSTTTTSNGNSILAVAPAVFPTVLINPGAELSNAHEFSANNVRAVQNPLGWPTDYRRVPNYRPTNTILDMTERPYGANRIGWLVGHFLTTGVIIQSVSDVAAVHMDL